MRTNTLLLSTILCSTTATAMADSVCEHDAPVVSAPASIAGVLEPSDADESPWGVAWADGYDITLEAGQSLRVRMTSDELDPVLEIVAPSDCSALEINDDFDGLNAQITFTAPETGTYRIVATTFDGQGGRYDLELETLEMDACPSATMSIAAGETLTSSLDLDDPDDGLRGPGVAYEAIEVTLEPGLHEVRMTSSDFDAYVYVMQGCQIVAEDDDGAGNLNALASVPAGGGTYTIVATAFSAGGLGDYSLSVDVPEEDPTDPEPSNPTCALEADGSLDQGRVTRGRLTSTDDYGWAYVDSYDVSLRAGERLELSMFSDDMDTYLTVYSPDCQVAISNDDVYGLNASLVMRASATGVYRVEASALGDGRGAYTLIRGRLPAELRGIDAQDRADLAAKGYSAGKIEHMAKMAR